MLWERNPCVQCMYNPIVFIDYFIQYLLQLRLVFLFLFPINLFLNINDRTPDYPFHKDITYKSK